MGETVRPTADPERIFDHAEQALKLSRTQGGEISAAAEAKLLEPLRLYKENKITLDELLQAIEQVMDQILLLDSQADTTIKTVRDELWNALGRPRDSQVMDTTFPGGVGTYTDANPKDQPTMMMVLEERVGAIHHPKISAEQKQDWSARVAADRLPYEQALVPLRGLEAREIVHRQIHRDRARVLAVALGRLKREFKNLGLSEREIHRIIPEDPRSPAKAKAPADPGSPAPPESPA